MIKTVGDQRYADKWSHKQFQGRHWEWATDGKKVYFKGSISGFGYVLHWNELGCTNIPMDFEDVKFVYDFMNSP